jgi:hypothetical protein
MTVRKLLLVAATAALMSTPAWALPGLAPADQGKGHGPPSTVPNNTSNPGSSHRSPEGTENTGGNQNNGNGQGDNRQGKGQNGKPSHPGNSHKCMPHKVGYVVSGTLASQTLTKNADGTYSGIVTVVIKHTNHHAAGDTGTKPYTVTNVHVTFGLADTNNDGSVGLDDLKAGDQVKLTGKITTLAKKCDQTGFMATTTIRKIVFHAPAG